MASRSDRVDTDVSELIVLLQTRSPLQYLPADPPTENSVDFLTEQGQNSSFARADIAKLAKRLAAGEPTPVADPDDSAALKVEKNALAILYIPALFALAEEILAGVLKKGTIVARKDGEKVVFNIKGEETGESKEPATAGA